MKAGTRIPSADDRERVAIESMVNGTIGGESKIGMPIDEVLQRPTPPEPA